MVKRFGNKKSKEPSLADEIEGKLAFRDHQKIIKG